MISRRWTFSSMVLEMEPTSPIGEPSKQASRGVNDPNLRDGGQNGSPHGLVTADDLRFAMVQQ